MVVLIQKRVHLEYWIRLDYRLFLAVRILCSFKALMCRAHLSEKVRYKVYKVSQKYLIILPPLFCWDIYILLLGTHLGGVSVDRINKGVHMEQSTSTGFEAGKEDNRLKAD